MCGRASTNPGLELNSSHQGEVLILATLADSGEDKAKVTPNVNALIFTMSLWINEWNLHFLFF